MGAETIGVDDVAAAGDIGVGDVAGGDVAVVAAGNVGCGTAVWDNGGDGARGAEDR